MTLLALSTGEIAVCDADELVLLPNHCLTAAHMDSCSAWLSVAAQAGLMLCFQLRRHVTQSVQLFALGQGLKHDRYIGGNCLGTMDCAALLLQSAVRQELCRVPATAVWAHEWAG